MTFDQPQLALLLSRRAVLTAARSALPDAPQVPVTECPETSGHPGHTGPVSGHSAAGRPRGRARPGAPPVAQRAQRAGLVGADDRVDAVLADD